MAAWDVFGPDSDSDGEGSSAIDAEALMDPLNQAYESAWASFLADERALAVERALPWLARIADVSDEQRLAHAELLVDEGDLSYICGACRGNDGALLSRAIAAYDAHLRLEPQNISAHRMRGEALLRMRRYEEAARAFLEVAELKEALVTADEATFRSQEVAPFRLRHDASQMDHLGAPGATALREAAAALEAAPLPGAFYGDAVSQRLRRAPFGALPPAHAAALRAVYGQAPLGQSLEAMHAPLWEAWPASRAVLNEGLDWDALRREYAASGMVVIDELLAGDALAELQRYGRAVPAFRTMRAGFLGAFPSDGACHPLVLRAAAAIEERLGGDLFHDSPLGLWWFFKYTEQSPKGIGIHADPARHNLNLWLTDDAARVEGGGLQVFETVPPLGTVPQVNHEFASAEEEQALFERLREGGMAHVPYRCNRATLFRSDRFHCSEPFRFREGYEHARLNLTLLWGDRAGAVAPAPA